MTRDYLDFVREFAVNYGKYEKAVDDNERAELGDIPECYVSRDWPILETMALNADCDSMDKSYPDVWTVDDSSRHVCFGNVPDRGQPLENKLFLVAMENRRDCEGGNWWNGNAIFDEADNGYPEKYYVLDEEYFLRVFVKPVFDMFGTEFKNECAEYVETYTPFNDYRAYRVSLKNLFDIIYENQ